MISLKGLYRAAQKARDVWKNSGIATLDRPMFGIGPNSKFLITCPAIIRAYSNRGI